jgi:hypothetical protein
MQVVPFSLVLVFSAGTVDANAQTRPADVKAGHWAESAVTQAVANKVMTVQSGAFRGEKRVTKTEVAVALAALARSLEAKTWKPAKSVKVPNKAVGMVDTTAWEKQAVSRYALAIVLTKFGNYFANGVPKPPAGTQDLAKSDVLPPKLKITLATNHPAYSALTYLTERRMIAAGSPLLKPDDKPLRAQELSDALAQMAHGLTNQVTELGRDDEGGTPDKTFRQKKQ